MFLVSKLELNGNTLFKNQENAEKWLNCRELVNKIIPAYLKKLEISINFPNENKLNNTEQNGIKNINIQDKSEKIEGKQISGAHENFCVAQENGEVDACHNKNKWSKWRGNVRQLARQTLTAFYNLQKLYEKNEEVIKQARHFTTERERIWQIGGMLKKRDAVSLMAGLAYNLLEIEKSYGNKLSRQNGIVEEIERDETKTL